MLRHTGDVGGETKFKLTWMRVFRAVSALAGVARRERRMSDSYFMSHAMRWCAGSKQMSARMNFDTVMVLRKKVHVCAARKL